MSVLCTPLPWEESGVGFSIRTPLPWEGLGVGFPPRIKDKLNALCIPQ